MNRWTIIIAITLLGVFLSGSAHAAVFTVNSASDGVDASPGDGICHTGTAVPTCTLRAAIEEANALSGADEIILPLDTYLLTIVTELGITGNLTITGGGASTTIIDGNGSMGLEIDTCPFANLPEKKRTRWALTKEEMKNCHGFFSFFPTTTV